MKKVEEFNKTQALIDEFKNFSTRDEEIENEKKQINLRIERLEEEMQPNEEDEEFNLDYESVKEIYNEKINKEKKEMSKLEDEQKNLSDSKKHFRTDENLQTITVEIEEMKKEIRKEELELKKKDIELEEFYMEENHENPIKWQEIYNEQDKIKNNIKALNSKIEEYTNFKNELLETQEKIIIMNEDKKVESTTKAEPATKVEPTTKAEPATKVEPTTKAEPATKVESTTKTDPTTKTEPTTKVTKDDDDKKLKISIREKVIEITVDENEPIEIEKKELRNYMKKFKYNDSKKEMFGELTKEAEEYLEDMDPKLLAAFDKIEKENLVSNKQLELIKTRYLYAVTSDKEISGSSTLKKIIEYDRTNLDYLKPSNIVRRIIHKSDFDDMRYYADFAENMNIAEIKQDEPGKIRKFLSKAWNKIPMVAARKEKLLLEEKRRERLEERSDDEKALADVMDKYREGRIGYKSEVKADIDKGKLDKVNDFKNDLKVKVIPSARKTVRENKERANAFATHTTIKEEYDRRQDGEALLDGMNKYREGKVGYKGEVKADIDKGNLDKINDLKESIKVKVVPSARKTVKENKERANAFARHTTIEDQNNKNKGTDR